MGQHRIATSDLTHVWVGKPFGSPPWWGEVHNRSGSKGASSSSSFSLSSSEVDPSPSLGFLPLAVRGWAFNPRPARCSSRCIPSNLRRCPSDEPSSASSWAFPYALRFSIGRWKGLYKAADPPATEWPEKNDARWTMTLAPLAKRDDADADAVVVADDETVEDRMSRAGAEH